MCVQTFGVVPTPHRDRDAVAKGEWCDDDTSRVVCRRYGTRVDVDTSERRSETHTYRCRPGRPLAHMSGVSSRTTLSKRTPDDASSH